MSDNYAIIEGSCSSAAGAALEWLPPQKTGPGTAVQHSKCRRYRIDGLKAGAFLSFTAWSHRTSPLGLNEKWGSFDTGEEARAVCERHMRSREGQQVSADGEQS